MTDDEGVLIVMEYVRGHTLRDEIAAGPLQPARAIEVLTGVAAALDHAHEHGVVHRDVKPANVLIADRGGVVKLADLGIATAAERTRITHSGTVLGTAPYMAPERLDGDSTGPAVDVYALAAVAYEALSGRKAFGGQTALEIARRIASQPPPDLAAAVPGTPPAVADALRRGLAKDPSERPPSAGALVRELADAYARSAAPGPPPTAPTRPIGSNGAPAAVPASPPVQRAGRSRRPLVVAGLALALAALVVALALGSGGGGHAKPQASTPKRSHPAKRAHHHHRTAPASAPSATTGGAAATPTAAVERFYALAAQHDFAAAWALGTDGLHSQLISLDAFSRQQQRLESISFPRLQVSSQSGDSAVVDFESAPVLDGQTLHYAGQARAVRGSSGGWLLDQLLNVHQIGASPPPPPAPAPKGKDHAQQPPGHGPKKHGGGEGGGD